MRNTVYGPFTAPVWSDGEFPGAPAIRIGQDGVPRLGRGCKPMDRARKHGGAGLPEDLCVCAAAAMSRLSPPASPEHARCMANRASRRLLTPHAMTCVQWRGMMSTCRAVAGTCRPERPRDGQQFRRITLRINYLISSPKAWWCLGPRARLRHLTKANLGAKGKAWAKAWSLVVKLVMLYYY